MKKILKRYVIMTAIILLILFIINAVVFYCWQLSRDEESPSKISYLQDSITEVNGVIKIKDDALDYVNKNYQWMMIINNDGNVVYKNKLPQELNYKYTIGEVSDFSKWYLNNYPVSTINSPYGLIVLGDKKDSIWKNNFSIKKNTIIPTIIILIMTNLIIGAVLSLIFSLLFFKDLRIITKSILNLSQDEPQNMEEKGYLQDVYHSINTVSDKLIRQMDEINTGKEMKSKWLQGVSHDIRTPLAIISGNSQALLDNCNDKEERNKLELISSQCFKIKDLLSDLNLINSLENNITINKSDVVDVDKTIRNCIADIMNTYDLEKYNISFSSNLKNNTNRIEGDEKLLGRAFNNIIANSIKHNQNGCDIKISSELADDIIKITFSDNGVGTDVQKIAKLQNIKSDQNNSEHGWGLIVVKEIIALHSGKITFEDNPPGLTISIYLPKKS